MEAAGQHNHPPPASETVIEGLPRIKLDQETLGECVGLLRYPYHVTDAEHDWGHLP
jgi:hypothetical protein